MFSRPNFDSVNPLTTLMSNKGVLGLQMLAKGGGSSFCLSLDLWHPVNS